MIFFDDKIKKDLITLGRTKNVYLEGNILKLIDVGKDKEFEDYVKLCVEKDTSNRKRRLDITRQIQKQNMDLSHLNDENQKIMEELQVSIKNIEQSKEQIENQNEELLTWKEENERLTLELKGEMVKSEEARLMAEKAKDDAENNLDIMQKRTQFQLINIIVKIALSVVISVGIIVTVIYMVALFTNKDTQIIGSTWSNMLGILLTNAFSIIGTIMGVKYASSDSNNQSP